MVSIQVRRLRCAPEGVVAYLGYELGRYYQSRTCIRCAFKRLRPQKTSFDVLILIAA